MKRIVLAAALAGAFAAPAFAQDMAEMVCAEYSSLDNAGQMAMLAELEAQLGEGTGNMTSSELSTMLSAECTAHPDKLLTDAAKEMHKM